MRLDLDQIQRYIKQKSHILDLGCGGGELLLQLQQQKNVTGIGLENDPNYIQQCIEKGINVVEHNLNEGLEHIADNSYDTVIMTLAIQAMERPDKVLEDMLRIGSECIVTFPNFGHWQARWQLFFYGRMPKSDILPYEWYNTPNIHFCTMKDFENLCLERNITILDSTVVSEKTNKQWLACLNKNLFGETAIYHLTKK